jgi:hypothetical protein
MRSKVNFLFVLFPQNLEIKQTKEFNPYKALFIKKKMKYKIKDLAIYVSYL